MRTSRRGLLAMMAVGAGAAALGGCRDNRPALPVGAPDPLLLETGTGLATLHGTRRSDFPAAVAAWDSTTVYAARPDGDDTNLLTVATATGRVAEPAGRLQGRWVPRVVSADGSVLALLPADAPKARESTRIALSSPYGQRDSLTLAGNYEPEAFSADRSALFVLEWLPALAPERYRVRVVDLTTKAVGPLLTRAKQPVGVEEEMRPRLRPRARPRSPAAFAAGDTFPIAPEQPTGAVDA